MTLKISQVVTGEMVHVEGDGRIRIAGEKMCPLNQAHMPIVSNSHIRILCNYAILCTYIRTYVHYITLHYITYCIFDVDSI